MGIITTTGAGRVVTPPLFSISNFSYISYCVGYRAIWQVIARVCEVLPEPKARVILTHECNNLQYCPINHVISCLLPSSSSTWC